MPIQFAIPAHLATLAGAILIAGCGSSQATSSAAEAPAAATGATAAQPTVVELFQSQGCSSCPPANAAVNAITDRPDVLALSFGVTYWDQLGWKDTFASPRYTARQWDYAHHAGRAQVATPQVIVNGGTAIVGSNRQQLAQTIASAGSPKGGPALEAAGDAVKVGALTNAKPSTVWLVRYDPKSREVPIRAGENGGKTLPHRDIVRQLVKLGDWRGAAVRYPLPAPSESGLRTAVLVQQGTGGAITAARRL
ncbi:DUF1223 domain-containing protein [Sphingomonas oligophenolica]|uniref:DUF1223 domain-containing protein n=1 Tax=Sphingomonas oligophenolica TaxID=301154 RepID=A0A502CDS3_9SPHN|nr:DUF1223 domain-containing protein [Sphingomonas oligophenolica]TPG09936.1 DUF1223 domain-containing protein [Sphingomonas oligophenolica]